MSKMDWYVCSRGMMADLFITPSIADDARVLEADDRDIFTETFAADSEKVTARVRRRVILGLLAPLLRVSSAGPPLSLFSFSLPS
jgi:hypothetical protein